MHCVTIRVLLDKPMVGITSSYHNISQGSKIVWVRSGLNVYNQNPNIIGFTYNYYGFTLVQTQKAKQLLCNPYSITGLTNGRNTFLSLQYKLENQNSVCVKLELDVYNQKPMLSTPNSPHTGLSGKNTKKAVTMSKTGILPEFDQSYLAYDHRKTIANSNKLFETFRLTCHHYLGGVHSP